MNDDRIAKLNKALKARFGKDYSTGDGVTLNIYIKKGGYFLARKFESIEAFEHFVDINKNTLEKD